MRVWRAIAAAIVVLAATGRGARADAIADGQERARNGDYDGAIVQFREAERAQPRAATACLIGLAELRRHEPGRAEVWFTICHRRARPDDPLPDWLAGSERELATQLAPLAPITLSADHARTDVELGIVGWDVTFSPRVVHLAPGHYHVTARTPDGSSDLDVDVVGAAAQHVTVHVPAAPVTAPNVPDGPPVPPPPLHHRSNLWLIGGAAVLGVAGVADLTAVNYTHSRLEGVSADDYDKRYRSYQVARVSTIGLLGLGSAAVIYGLVLRHRETSDAPQIAAGVVPGGAVLTLAWSR